MVVSARLRGSRVRLVVADSGVGIGRGLLERLRAAAAGAGSRPQAVPGQGGPGIGMANLEERLAYRYGEAAALAIASRPGKGTIVRVSLPLREGGGDAA